MQKRLITLFVCLIIFLAITNFGQGQAQSSNQVGLVVSYGDGQVWSGCVAISASSATGLDVLQNSGLKLVLNYTPIGAAVCKIGNVGCPADNCFCKSPPDSWNYWHLQGGSWTYSNLGASNAKVNSGAVEGWSWGQSGSAQPPLLTFDQICAAAAVPTDTLVPATATSAPTVTPLSPTDTVASSKTPQMTNTAKPSKTPTLTTTTQSSKTPLPLTNTIAPGETSLPTQTPVADTPTPVEQTADLQQTPSTTPQLDSTIRAVAMQIAATQASMSPAGVKESGGHPATASRDLSGLSTLLVQSGYPIFAVLLIGLGILLAIVARRKMR
jgi:hypothetical protein